MKKYFLVFFLGLISIFILGSCSSMMTGMMKNKMFKHYQSNLDFEATYDHMYKNIDNSENWTIISTYDNKERYSSEGELLNYKVIQICHPETAYKILIDDETKYMGGMIPLKLCIYEKNSGGVFMSFMNTEMMSDMFDDESISSTILECSEELIEYIDDIKTDE